jgi:hypothetical protein
VFAQFAEWWRSLRPTQRRRLLLVMLVPALGLALTGYQIATTIFGDQEVKVYDITPSATIAPTIEPPLFEVGFARKPLITDDIFNGVHKQIESDIEWLQVLDVDRAREYGAGVWPTVDNIRQLFGDPQKLGVDSIAINVRKTGTESAEVGLSLVYEDAQNRRYPVTYSLIYEIERTDPVTATDSPTYKFKLVQLESDVAGVDNGSGDGAQPGEEVIS